MNGHLLIVFAVIAWSLPVNSTFLSAIFAPACTRPGRQRTFIQKVFGFDFKCSTRALESSPSCCQNLASSRNPLGIWGLQESGQRVFSREVRTVMLGRSRQLRRLRRPRTSEQNPCPGQSQGMERTMCYRARHQKREHWLWLDQNLLISLHDIAQSRKIMP